MYSSLETMKGLATDEDALRNLTGQQNDILKTWIIWEQGIIRQAAKC